MRRCLNCGVEIQGHPNKKFCSSEGKDSCKVLYKANYSGSTEPDEYLEEFMDDTADNIEATWDDTE